MFCHPAGGTHPSLPVPPFVLVQSLSSVQEVATPLTSAATPLTPAASCLPSLMVTNTSGIPHTIRIWGVRTLSTKLAPVQRYWRCPLYLTTNQTTPYKVYTAHSLLVLTCAIGPNDGCELLEGSNHLMPFVGLEVLQLKTLQKSHFYTPTDG